MGAPPRQFTAIELDRMKRAVENGIVLSDVARRFSTTIRKVSAVAAEHGWTVPYAERIYSREAAKPKYIGRPPKPKARRFLYRALAERDPDDLAGGRRLQGAEFEFYKAQYEARDRAERARAQA